MKLKELSMLFAVVLCACDANTKKSEESIELPNFLEVESGAAEVNSLVAFSTIYNLEDLLRAAASDNNLSKRGGQVFVTDLGAEGFSSIRSKAILLPTTLNAHICAVLDDPIPEFGFPGLRVRQSSGENIVTAVVNFERNDVRAAQKSDAFTGNVKLDDQKVCIDLGDSAVGKDIMFEIFPAISERFPVFSREANGEIRIESVSVSIAK